MLKDQLQLVSLTIFFSFLMGCSPKNQYDQFILSQGYIPFQQPLANLGVGSLLKGSPQKLHIVAPAKTCFPSEYNGVLTEIRQVTDADLPEIAKKVSVEAGVDANVIAANGTPLFKINSNFQALKSLDVRIEGASIEYLDELIFADWVNSAMSSACKNYLVNGGSFIRQALRVDKMSFQFKNSVGGKIAISADNIKDIIDIDAHIQWKISNDFTLTITSPKYIGYHLAKVNPQNPSSIALIASNLTEDGKFNFVPVAAYRSFNHGLMNLK